MQQPGSFSYIVCHFPPKLHLIQYDNREHPLVGTCSTQHQKIVSAFAYPKSTLIHRMGCATPQTHALLCSIVQGGTTTHSGLSRLMWITKAWQAQHAPPGGGWVGGAWVPSASRAMYHDANLCHPALGPTCALLLFL